MKIIVPVLIILVLGGGVWWFISQNNDADSTLDASANANTVANTSAEVTTNTAAKEEAETTTNTSTVPPDAPNLGTVPSFSLKNYAGETVSFEQYAGKPLVINSWAAWCPYCIDELPDFASVQKEYGDSITIIAINRAESLNTAQKYTNDLGVTDDLIYLLDPSDSFYSSIGGFSMPETILVDSEGIIRDHVRGPINDAMLKSKLSEKLGIN